MGLLIRCQAVAALLGVVALAGCGGTTGTLNQALLPRPAAPAQAGKRCPADQPVQLPRAMYGSSRGRLGEEAVVSPLEAARAVRAFWPLEERAGACDDIALTDEIEVGPAREYADAVSRADRAVRGLSLRTVRPLGAVHVYVPLQTSYPARFLAQVVTTTYTRVAAGTQAPPAGSAAVEILVFVRSGPRSPWKAAIDTIRTETTYVDANTPGAHGFEAPPPRPDWINPSAVPELLAHYWSQWLTTGHAPDPNPFASGYATTVVGSQLASSTALDRAHGSDSRVAYYASARDGVYQFAVDGQNLTCFAVRYHLRLTPVIAVYSLLQDRARTHYGGLLPPGAYTSIDEGGLHQSCALIHVHGPSQGILVIGRQGGYTSEIGHR